MTTHESETLPPLSVAPTVSRSRSSSRAMRVQDLQLVYAPFGLNPDERQITRENASWGANNLLKRYRKLVLSVALGRGPRIYEKSQRRLPAPSYLYSNVFGSVSVPHRLSDVERVRRTMRAIAGAMKKVSAKPTLGKVREQIVPPLRALTGNNNARRRVIERNVAAICRRYEHPPWSISPDEREVCTIGNSDESLNEDLVLDLHAKWGCLRCAVESAAMLERARDGWPEAFLRAGTSAVWDPRPLRNAVLAQLWDNERFRCGVPPKWLFPQYNAGHHASLYGVGRSGLHGLAMALGEVLEHRASDSHLEDSASRVICCRVDVFFGAGPAVLRQLFENTESYYVLPWTCLSSREAACNPAHWWRPLQRNTRPVFQATLNRWWWMVATTASRTPAERELASDVEQVTQNFEHRTKLVACDTERHRLWCERDESVWMERCPGALKLADDEDEDEEGAKGDLLRVHEGAMLRYAVAEKSCCWALDRVYRQLVVVFRDKDAMQHFQHEFSLGARLGDEATLVHETTHQQIDEGSLFDEGHRKAMLQRADEQRARTRHTVFHPTDTARVHEPLQSALELLEALRNISGPSPRRGCTVEQLRDTSVKPRGRNQLDEDDEADGEAAYEYDDYEAEWRPLEAALVRQRSHPTRNDDVPPVAEQGHELRVAEPPTWNPADEDARYLLYLDPRVRERAARAFDELSRHGACQSQRERTLLQARVMYARLRTLWTLKIWERGNFYVSQPMLNHAPVEALVLVHEAVGSGTLPTLLRELTYRARFEQRSNNSPLSAHQLYSSLADRLDASRLGTTADMPFRDVRCMLGTPFFQDQFKEHRLLLDQPVEAAKSERDDDETPGVCTYSRHVGDSHCDLAAGRRQRQHWATVRSVEHRCSGNHRQPTYAELLDNIPVRLRRDLMLRYGAYLRPAN